MERLSALKQTKARLERKLASDKPRHVATRPELNKRLAEINRSLEYYEKIAARN